MRYRNGRYARQISRNINSGIYLGPTQGLSSPKNNRRACLCTDKNTYSRDCCNGNLIAQGVGNIQAPADTISTSTTTTTSGPTTTTTSGPTTTSTSTTSTSTSTSTTAAPTTTSTSTSTSTTSTSTSTSTTSTSTSTTTAAPTTTSTSTTSTSTTTVAPTSTTTTTAAPSPVVTDSLVSWQNYLTFNPTSSIWVNSGPIEPSNYAVFQGTQPTLSGSLGIRFNGTDNYLSYNAFGAGPNDVYTLQMYGTFPQSGFPFENYDLWVNEDLTDGWDTIYSTEGKAIYRDTGTKQIDLGALKPAGSVLTMLTLVCRQGESEVKVYINTTEVGNMSAGAVAQWFQQDAVPQFGWNANSDANYFKGTVKQLLIYSTTLSQEQITYNYNGLSSL